MKPPAGNSFAASVSQPAATGTAAHDDGTVDAVADSAAGDAAGAAIPPAWLQGLERHEGRGDVLSFSLQQEGAPPRGGASWRALLALLAGAREMRRRWGCLRSMMVTADWMPRDGSTGAALTRCAPTPPSCRTQSALVLPRRDASVCNRARCLRPRGTARRTACGASCTAARARACGAPPACREAARRSSRCVETMRERGSWLGVGGPLDARIGRT